MSRSKDNLIYVVTIDITEIEATSPYDAARQAAEYIDSREACELRMKVYDSDGGIHDVDLEIDEPEDFEIPEADR